MNNLIPQFSNQLSKAAAILWFKKPTWTVDEAAILLSDLAPEQFAILKKETDYQQTREMLIAANIVWTNASNKAVEIKQVLQGENFTESATPMVWLHRAKTLGLDIPSAVSVLG